MMADLLRAFAVLLLVLTEVALWQWRTILTARDARLLPTLLGIAGAIIQVTAIAQVITHVTSPLTVAAYALGVGGGVFAGVIVSGRFSAATIGLNVITSDPGLALRLQDRGWPVTFHPGQGHEGRVQMLLIVVDGKHRADLVDDLAELAPDAFWTTELLHPGPAIMRPQRVGI